MPARVHLSLLAVVVVWAGRSRRNALLDDGVAAGDIAIFRYAIAAPRFGFILWRTRGLPGLTRHDAARVVVVVALRTGEDLSLESAKGPLIVLGAPLSFALYNVILKPLLGRHDLLAVTAATSLVGTLGLVPLVRASTVETVVDASATDAALVRYLGVLATLLGYIGWNVSLRGLGPTRAVAYPKREPSVGDLGPAAARGGLSPPRRSLPARRRTSPSDAGVPGQCCSMRSGPPPRTTYGSARATRTASSR